MPTLSPPPDQGDPKLVELYRVIGYYITRWSIVEELLFIIYHRAMGLPPNQCANEFFLVDSYSMRVKFTIIAVRAKFRREPKKRKYWEERIKSFNEFYSFRNFIAHNPVHEPQLQIDFTFPRALVTREYVVHSYFYSERKQKISYNYGHIARKAKKLDLAIARLRKEISRDFTENPKSKAG